MDTGTWTLDLSAAVIIFNCGDEPMAFRSGRETMRLNDRKRGEGHHLRRRFEPGFRKMSNLLAWVSGPPHGVVAVVDAGHAHAINLRQFLVHGLRKRVKSCLRIERRVRQLREFGVEFRQNLGCLRARSRPPDA